jgi:hypothetical protein
MSWVHDFVLGYLGPDTILPVASALAAIVGVILICWRFLLGTAQKCFRCVVRRRPPADPTSATEPEDV